MNTDIHHQSMAQAIHIPKREREAAARVIADEPDRDELAAMLGLK